MLKELRKICIGSCMQLAILSLGRIKWRHMTLIITAGRNGSLYNFLNQVWHIRRTLLLTFVRPVKLFYLMSRLLMEDVNAAGQSLKSEISSNGFSELRTMQRSYWVI